MEDKHICTDVTSPLWKSCQFEAVRDWDRPGLCNVVRRSSSKTTFSGVCKHFSSLCKKTPAGARAPSVTSANFRHPRATVARSESLDCKDENRFFSWSEAKAIKKQFFFCSIGDCEIPPLLPVSALTQSQRMAQSEGRWEEEGSGTP